MKMAVFFHLGIGFLLFRTNNVTEVNKMIIATATQMKNGFGKYLSLTLKNGEIYIEKHGKIMAKMIAINDSRTYLSDELKETRRRKG